MILLHILWMILRFLLILIGILLGLVLLILLLVLFCPIRYQASVTKETENFKEITANASVSWLFRGIRVIADYGEGKLTPDIRIFGISLMKVKAFLEERKKKKAQNSSNTEHTGGAKKEPEVKHSDSAKKESKVSDTDSAEKEPEVSDTDSVKEESKANITDSAKKKTAATASGKPPAASGKGTPKSRTMDASVAKKKTVRTESIRSGDSPKDPYGTSFAQKKERAEQTGRRKTQTDPHAGFSDTDTIDPDFDDLHEEQETLREPILFRLIEAIFDRIGRLFEKIGNLWERIHTTISGLFRKKEQLEEKIDYWKDFLSHPSIRPAISLIWKKLILLLKHIFPTKMAGDLSFGFEDPSVTGQILAIAGMTIPLHKNAVRIHPDFEGDTHVEGTLWLKGRIYGIVFAVTAIRILLNKNIRYIYRRFKKKEE